MPLLVLPAADAADGALAVALRQRPPRVTLPTRPAEGAVVAVAAVV
jgi:hypothetical protein